jgi:hypothetical protein
MGDFCNVLARLWERFLFWARRPPRSRLAFGCALALAGLVKTAVVQAQSSPPRVAFGEQWTATDALGRALPSAQQVGPPRADRYIGIFYWLWHGYTRTSPIRDVTQTLKANPTSPTWYYQDYFWGQPEAGYYHSSDPWVARRNLQMLANAGIDFLFFDFTNGPIGKESLNGFLDVAEEMRGAGIQVPYFVFFLNSAGADTLNWLYANVYGPGKYRELWFQWDGKPLIMADPAFASSSEIASFFTFRHTWAFQSGERDEWRFIDNYPQRASWHAAPDQPEQICVSKSMGAPLVPKGQRNDKGSSFHAGMEAQYDQQWLSPDTAKGLYFDEQWQRALQVDPQIVLVTGWNELTAGAWTAEGGMVGNYSFMGRELKSGDYYFVDEFNAEFNRDLEPMAGGYTDSYYYQLVAYARRFKGMHAREAASSPTSVQLDGEFADWRDVGPVFHDPPGDTVHRNFRNTDGSAQLTNATGRNDIVESRVTHDESTLFFYAKTAAPLSPATDPSWMLLFIDSDQNKSTGFQGFDYLVGDGTPGKRALLRWQGGQWQSAGEVPFAYAENELELSVAKSLIGASSPAPRIDFHWADNIKSLTDVTELFVNGDSAPDRRFDFRYDAQPCALGCTGTGGAAGGGGADSFSGAAGATPVAGASQRPGGGMGGAGGAPPTATSGSGGAEVPRPAADSSCACHAAAPAAQGMPWLALVVASALARRRRGLPRVGSCRCREGSNPPNAETPGCFRAGRFFTVLRRGRDSNPR